MSCPYLNYREAEIKFMMMSNHRLHRSHSVPMAIDLVDYSGMIGDRMLVRSILTFDLSFGINSYRIL